MQEKSQVVLRKVVEDDANFLWHLANDPEVREASFSTVPIPWDDHIKWLRTRLADPSCIFFIALNEENVPIGQLRLDMKGEDAVVSISIKKEYRGKNYGAKMIKIATDRVFDLTKIMKIKAFAKVNNKNSISAFLKAKFKLVEQVSICGHEAFYLIRERSK